MKHSLTVKNLIWALFAALLSIPWASAQEKLSLEQAVRKALESNPDLAIDVPARAAASAEQAASKAGYRPRLDVEQSVLGGKQSCLCIRDASDSKALHCRRLRSAVAEHPRSGGEPADAHYRSAKHLGLRTHPAARGSRTPGCRMTDLGHDDHVRQMLLAVIESYYAISLAREGQEAAKAAMTSAEAMVKQAQSRVDSGLAVEADLLRGQVYLASARQQQIQAQGQEELARAQLNRLMGLPLDQSIRRNCTADASPVPNALGRFPGSRTAQAPP